METASISILTISVVLELFLYFILFLGSHIFEDLAPLLSRVTNHVIGRWKGMSSTLEHSNVVVDIHATRILGLGLANRPVIYGLWDGYSTAITVP